VVDFIYFSKMPPTHPQVYEKDKPVVSEGGVLNLYYINRRFDVDSTLHCYLARKCPTLISKEKQDYNLYEVNYLSRNSIFTLCYMKSATAAHPSRR